MSDAGRSLGVGWCCGGLDCVLFLGLERIGLAMFAAVVVEDASSTSKSSSGSGGGRNARESKRVQFPRPLL